jgi:hypothetical protein
MMFNLDTKSCFCVEWCIIRRGACVDLVEARARSAAMTRYYFSRQRGHNSTAIVSQYCRVKWCGTRIKSRTPADCVHFYCKSGSRSNRIVARRRVKFKTLEVPHATIFPFHFGFEANDSLGTRLL